MDVPSCPMPTPLRRALPNAITLARLALAVVFFLLLQCVLLLLQGIGRQIVRQLVRRSKMTGF